MKLPPYMLVRRSDPSAAETSTPSDEAVPGRPTKLKTSTEMTRAIERALSTNPELKKQLDQLNPDWQRMLLGALGGTRKALEALAARNPVVARPRKKAQRVFKASRKPAAVAWSTKKAARADDATGVDRLELQRADPERTITEGVLPAQPDLVGVLDLGAWVGELPRLLERLNGAQERYAIFEVNAPVPAGLRRTISGMRQWIKAQGVRLTRKEIAELEPHVIANDYFVAAEDIRLDFKFDLLLGLSGALVAIAEKRKVYWNHFAAVQGQTALISTADLRDFAKRAGRPFEIAVGVLMVGAVLVAFDPKLDYHKNCGCVLDKNELRETLVETIRNPALCESCRSLLSIEDAKAADAMLAALRKLKGKTS